MGLKGSHIISLRIHAEEKKHNAAEDNDQWFNFRTK